MKRRLLAVVILATFVAGFTGCALLGLKPWADLSPKQKVIYFERVWLSTAENTDFILKDPKATETAKKAATQDKAALSKLYPLIKAYRAVVDGGGIPLPVDEKLIFDLIDQLVNKL